MSSPERPRGRRPGASETRETILASARVRFAEHGYDRTRIRDVAADAGVDPALVHYFFKSKDGLFAAVMQLPYRPSELIGSLLEEGVDGLGERLVRRLLLVWDDPGTQDALVAMLRAATAGSAATPGVREFLRREIVDRLAAALGDDRPELRANLVASQIVGLFMARYLARIEPLASLEADEVVRAVAPTLQRYLDGRL